eukprot:8626807-Pyramimonas_sp.AAC.1
MTPRQGCARSCAFSLECAPHLAQNTKGPATQTRWPPPGLHAAGTKPSRVLATRKQRLQR